MAASTHWGRHVPRSAQDRRALPTHITNQRQTNLFGSGDGDTKVTPEEQFQIEIVDTAYDDGGNSRLLGPVETLTTDQRAAYKDRPPVRVGNPLRCQFVFAIVDGDCDRTHSLTAYAENPLHETARGLHCGPLTGNGLNDMAVKIGGQGQWSWRLSQKYLPGHLRHGLDRSGDWGRDLSLQPFEEGLVLGQRLAGTDRITFPFEHIALDLLRDDPQQIDDIDRMDLAWQVSLSDHRHRGDRLPIMDKHLPGNR